MQNLSGKTAFVTGGASGIGLGIAKALKKAGMRRHRGGVRRRRDGHRARADHLGDELEGVRRHARRRQLRRVPVAVGRGRSAAGAVLQPGAAVRDQQGRRGCRLGTLVDLRDRVEGGPGDDARAVGPVPEPDRRRRPALANSKGRGINEIVEPVGGVPVAQNQFNSAALGAATQNIKSAAVSGDLQGFLDNLEGLQSS